MKMGTSNLPLFLTKTDTNFRIIVTFTRLSVCYGLILNTFQFYQDLGLIPTEQEKFGFQDILSIMIDLKRIIKITIYNNLVKKLQCVRLFLYPIS